MGVISSESNGTQEFVSLLTDHQEVLRAYIISQIPGSPEVRDVLQDVNVLLWERMNDFELGTNFGAWACTIAYYKILDYRKKMKREGALVFSEELSKKLAAETEDWVPMALEAKRRALSVCLGKLSIANRALLEARYDSSRGSLEQFSSETGRSRISLRVTLSRLRTSLRRCIVGHLAMEGVER